MGQFGSLYDQMDWSARNHNVFTAVNFEINSKWSLFENFIWNRGRGQMAGIGLDPSKVPAVPAGFNYVAMSELGKFSALNADRTQNITGLNYQISEKWAANAAYFFGQFKDKSPYLLDATGRTQGVEFGINYIF